MKVKYKITTGFLLIIALIMFNVQQAYSQEEEKEEKKEFKLSAYRTMYKFETTKQSDNSRLLEVSFMARNKKDRKDRLPVSGAEINFYNVLEDTEVLLGKAKTDQYGNAELVLSPDQSYMKDEEGFIELHARFNKNKKMKAQKKKLKVKDLIVDLDLKEVDSVNTVFVTAYELDSSNQKMMVDDLEVQLAVQGMLSSLMIEKDDTKEGVIEYEFPDNIRGDVNGDFELLATVLEHDDYGTVIVKANSNWGVFDDIQEPEKNKLWTEAAPIWMYVVLTLLLAGVWSNFIYTIVKLISIKKMGYKA
jgi:hypothetical protein